MSSTSVYPYLCDEELKIAEDESAAKELCWLLESLEETFLSLKSGSEECKALLAPIHQGSTLVLSSPRSESVKGHVTRVGSRIVKGTFNLRLRTHAPLNLTISPPSSASDADLSGFSLPCLVTLCKLLDQCLDCLDAIPANRAEQPTIAATSTFVLSQLKLLESFFQEALSILKASFVPPPPSDTSIRSSVANTRPWVSERFQDHVFTPKLPPTLALDIGISDCALLLIFRVLEPCSQLPSIGSLFLTGIGAQRRLEHDEMNDEFSYRDEMVRVKEKYQVESSADPCLLSCAAKLQVLERSVLAAIEALSAVMGYGG